MISTITIYATFKRWRHGRPTRTLIEIEELGKKVREEKVKTEVLR